MACSAAHGGYHRDVLRYREVFGAVLEPRGHGRQSSAQRSTPSHPVAGEYRCRRRERARCDMKEKKDWSRSAGASATEVQTLSPGHQARGAGDSRRRGIAGLTAANALAHAGVDCVVLEARERIGGRLHTMDLVGSPVDMGGSWIHHPIGNPLRVFADHVRVPCRSGDPLPRLSGFDLAEGRRLSRSEVEASLAMQFEAFPEAVGRLRERSAPTASVAEAIDAFVAGARLRQMRRGERDRRCTR